MRVRLMSAHGENRVEQQYALLRPGLQAAVVRDEAAEIIVELPKDILQARRRGHARQLWRRLLWRGHLDLPVLEVGQPGLMRRYPVAEYRHLAVHLR